MMIVVMRVDDFILDPVPGSTLDLCSRCSAPVVLSPSSQGLLREGPCQLVCNRCEQPQDLPLHNTVAPGAWDELEELQGRQAVEAAKELLSRWNRRSN